MSSTKVVVVVLHAATQVLTTSLCTFSNRVRNLKENKLFLFLITANDSIFMD